MSGEFLHNAVLNYVTRSMQTEIKSDSLIRSCVQFFEKEAILEAKKILFALLRRTMRKACERRRQCGTHWENAARCAKDRKSLPKFAIYDPVEVPASSELVGFYAISKINEMYKKS